MRSRVACFGVCLFLFSGCSKEQLLQEGKVTGYDDLGRRIVLSHVPQRIVLTSASPVDALFELGVGDRIVGVPDNIERSYPETCRRYPSLLEKPRAGSFSTPNIETIVSLNPDLVICYASPENPSKYTAVFEKRGLPYAGFYTAEGVAHGLGQIQRLGALLGKEKEAGELARRIRNEIDDVASMIKRKAVKHPLVYYWFGWGITTCGRKAAVHELIHLAGGVNLTGEFDRQFMELSSEYVIDRNPDVIVISCWQEDRREAQVREIRNRPGFGRIKAVRSGRIYTIDGHALHTPVRFAEAVRILAGFFHPEMEGRPNER